MPGRLDPARRHRRRDRRATTPPTTSVGLPGSDDSTAADRGARRSLREPRAAGAWLALPVPGDLLGLPAPPSSTLDVWRPARRVVARGRRPRAWCRHRSGAGVVWTLRPRGVLPPAARPLARPTERSRHAMREATDALAALDVARRRPEVGRRADGAAPATPTSTSPRHRAARRTAWRRATGCRTLVDARPGGRRRSVSRVEADAAGRVLRALDHAATRVPGRPPARIPSAPDSVFATWTRPSTTLARHPHRQGPPRRHVDADARRWPRSTSRSSTSSRS